MTAAAHIKQRGVWSQGLHVTLNERAPRDTEVVSAKENCTACQTVTIGPHKSLKGNELHLGLGAEKRRQTE